MGKIEKHSSLEVAEKVLAQLEKLNTNYQLKEGFIECFDNCREQGYVLTLFNPNSKKIGGTLNIAFAQNRNSDSIVVYIYNRTAHPSNLPADDKGWDNKKYFAYNEQKETAKYIMNEAVKFLNGKKSK